MIFQKFDEFCCRNGQEDCPGELAGVEIRFPSTVGNRFCFSCAVSGLQFLLEQQRHEMGSTIRHFRRELDALEATERD